MCPKDSGCQAEVGVSLLGGTSPGPAWSPESEQNVTLCAVWLAPASAVTLGAALTASGPGF